MHDHSAQCSRAWHLQPTQYFTECTFIANYDQSSNAGKAEDIGRSLLAYGRRIPREELFARLDAVDQDTIRAVADRFIYDQVRPSSSHTTTADT